ILVLVENLTAKVIDYHHQEREVTPFLNQLKKKSIWFENVYAAADRSDKTVVSVLSGYPAQPRETLIEHSEKIKNIPYLSSVFNASGYSTRFYYGGDPAFLSLKDYLYISNFEKIVEKGDFMGSAGLSSLGAPDSVVYRKFLADHESTGPVFSTILTLS